MRKGILTLVLILATVGAAWASPRGDWEFTYAVPSFSSSGIITMSAVSEDTLMAVGIHQSSAYGMENAWISTDAGESYQVIYGLDLSGITDECEMMAFFTFPVGGDWYDIDHGVMGGISIPQECYETLEFPACMFKCMFQMKPVIWTVTDAGQTVVRYNDVGGNLAKMYVDFKMADEDTIWACGNNGLLRKSDDFGETWMDMPAPETGQDSSMNYMQWLNPDVGYIATGYSAEEETKADPKNFEDVKKFVMDRLNYIRWVKSAAARIELQQQGYDPSKGGRALPNGAAYRTLDGGHSWEKVYGGDGFEPVYRVQFMDVMHGWVMTSDVYSTQVGETIKYTTDGGETWTDSAMPDPPDGYDLYDLSDFRMLTPSLGMASGVKVVFDTVTIPPLPPIEIYYTYSISLYTIDGGATWQVDEIGAIPTYPGDPQGYGFIGSDFHGATHGFAVGMNFNTARYVGTNAGPTAVAGADLTVAVGETVSLDGSGSTDPDGDALLYYWTQIDGPTTLEIADPYTAAPSFAAAQAGTYTIELSVSDFEYDSTDQIAVTVTADGDDDDTADDDAADDDDNGDDDDDDNDDSGCGC